MKLLFAIGFVLSAAHVLALPPVREIDEFKKGMLAHHKDLLQLTKFSRDSDRDGADGLLNVSEKTYDMADHVGALIYIYSLVTNDADKTTILSYINLKLSDTSGLIDLSIEEVNLKVSIVKGAALVSAADKLKADLRKLQTMIAAPR